MIQPLCCNLSPLRAALAAGLLLLASSAPALADGPFEAFESETSLAGIPFGFSQAGVPEGTLPTLRGLVGAPGPWVLEESEVEIEPRRLKRNGLRARLELEIEGLVILATGENPFDAWVATVSCLVPNPDGGEPEVVNTQSRPFPASPEGHARLRTRLHLPEPCMAPTVLVGPGPNPGAWFAATGLSALDGGDDD